MKNRTYTVLALLTSVIFLTALASAFSPLFSSLQPNPMPFYTFAQTQENAPLSLSNLIKQGAAYQGSTSAPVTLIDFNRHVARDLQKKHWQDD